MANYCTNHIVFFSPLEAPLKALRKQICLCMDDLDRNNFLHLLQLNGYTEQETEDLCDRRDSFSYCDPKVTQEDGTFFFEVETETAWSPHVEVLQKLITDRHHGTIRLVYTAEEPGCGIYYNSDTEGRFFATRYKVDCCHNGEYRDEYFDDYQQLIDWVRQEYKDLSISKYENPEEIEAKITDLCANSTDDDYFYIDRFEVPFDEKEVA